MIKRKNHIYPVEKKSSFEQLKELEARLIAEKTQFLKQLSDSKSHMENMRAHYQNKTEQFQSQMTSLISRFPPDFKTMEELQKNWQEENRDMQKKCLEAKMKYEELVTREPDFLAHQNVIQKQVQNQLEKMLFSAIKDSNISLVHSLLEHKIDPNIQMNSDGYTQITPLIACTLWSYNEKIMEQLLNHGADINKTDDHKFTPLHTAAYFFSSNHCLFLLKKGADLSFKNIHGKTPADILEKEHHESAGPFHQKTYALLKDQLSPKKR
jgi:ankyrin repeat protein